MKYRADIDELMVLAISAAFCYSGLGCFTLTGRVLIDPCTV